MRATLQALPDLALISLVAHAETTLQPWLQLGGALLTSLQLPPQLRELVILHVTCCADGDYERVQHEAIAAAEGVAAEQIAAVVSGRLHDPCLGEYTETLDLVGTLVRTHTVDASGMAAVVDALGPRRTTELLVVVGYHLGAALFTNAVGLAPDPPAQQAVREAAATHTGR
ncbi:MAG: carboxymuconolactone decarboxylase family protein [Dermatophilaceae bacterium]